MSLSLSLTQMNAQKYSLWESFSKKLFFMNDGLRKFTRLNRHIVSKKKKTFVYKLNDSKNKITKYYY